MNVTRTLTITNDQLKSMADLPGDSKITSSGPTTGSNRKEYGGIYAEIESQEFKIEDCGKPIEMKAK